MNPTKIETNAVNKLKMVLERCENITTSITTNDKTPSLDGTICLYHTNEIRKDNIKGNVNVQVKGKKVNKKDLKKKEMNYPIEIADLRNFRIAGGAIFFVVYMEDMDNYKIYYNALLPLDLEEILNNVNDRQRTKNIKFVEFPQNDSRKITYLISKFSDDSRKQHSTAKLGYINDIKIAKYDSLIFTTIDPRDELFDYTFQLPIYIYGRKNGVDADIPLTKGFLDTLGANNIKMPVKVDGKPYYDQLSIEKSSETLKIKIGAGFTIDTVKGKLNYINKGNLRERIADLEFFIGIFQCQTVEIGDYKCTNIKMDGSSEKIEKRLSFYKEIQKFLDEINVTDCVDLDNMDEEEVRELEDFKLAIMKNTSMNVHDVQDNFIMIRHKIGNIVLGLWAEKVNDGEYVIENLFSGEHDIILNKDEMESVPACIYVLLKKIDFMELSNINYEHMIQTVVAVLYSQQYGMAVNALLLEMLAAFDENGGRDLRLIENVITIAKWLSIQESNNYLYALNHLQAIKRTRPFNKDELKKLYEIREDCMKNDNNTSILLGVSILLDNKSDVAHYLELMNAEECDNFKKFPIYNIVDGIAKREVQ